MSQTTSTIIILAALTGIVFLLGLALRFLAQELRQVRLQVDALEVRILRGAGLPTVPPPPPGQGETLQ